MKQQQTRSGSLTPIPPEQMAKYEVFMRAKREVRTVRFTLRLTAHERDALQRMAEFADCSMSEVVSFWIREHALDYGFWQGPLPKGYSKGGFHESIYNADRQEACANAAIEAAGNTNLNAFDVTPDDDADFGLTTNQEDEQSCE